MKNGNVKPAVSLLNTARVDSYFFEHNPLEKVEDKYRTIGRSHGNKGSIIKPVLGSEGRTHPNHSWGGADTGPKSSQDELEGEKSVCSHGSWRNTCRYI